MESADITPDSTGAPVPVHAGNAVVVAGDEAQDVLADEVVLVGSDVVDAADVQADTGEEGLPSGDGVGADDRVRGRELVVDVERGTARRHDVVTAVLAGRLEDGLLALGRQTL